ncbi:uncharacterized protein B0I36DRAFT_402827 [Microdochium trichocladiopsis]|uniref:Uncharacterized protein n=1 Tax=Microdochium trichocladiopsis TaxID=1682393 RepID=A0A9P8YG53_9PEZI|nr:uncharacterized protein B0I36DRAFT_402827 [Microdochium trichocladiopsis]KAH7037328.1 hypothetical protein B0I36DRAFT_402827 [Microdochium trichocladiopsis]
MRSSQESSRRHSMSSEDEFVRPHRGRLDSASQGPRRVRLPRSKSASNMLDAYGDATATIEDELRDVVREQVDRQALQELAEFLRTTGPRSQSAQNRYDECFRVPSSGPGPKRWSFQTLKSRMSKLERTSLQPLPENARPGITTKGNRFLAISVPEPDVVDGPWGRSQYPVYTADSEKQLACPESPSWPARISSRGALSPTSPAGSNAPLSLDLPTFSSFKFDVEQSSAKSSDFAELNRVLEQHLSLVTDSSAQDSAPASRSPVQTSPLDLDQGTGIISIRPRNAVSSMHSRERTASSISNRLRLQPHIDIETVASGAHDSTLPPNISRNPDLTSFSTRSAVTPPCMEQPEKQNFPEIRLDTLEEPSVLPLRLHARGLSAFPQTSPPGSPPSSRKPRPAKLTVGSSLTVPEETILPDSPGFPLMLAAMNFPSPPKSTPGHSPTSSVSSSGPRPPSAQATRPLAIQPRTSSLRSNKDQTFSLDEMLMKFAPKSPPPAPSTELVLEDGVSLPDPSFSVILPMQPSSASPFPKKEETTITNVTMESLSDGKMSSAELTVRPPEPDAEDFELEEQAPVPDIKAGEAQCAISEAKIQSSQPDVSLASEPVEERTNPKVAPAEATSTTLEDDEPQRPRSSSSASTTKPERCESSVSFYTADESQRNSMCSANLDFHDFNRHSGMSDDPDDLSHLANSYRQSATTNDSYRQSGLTDDSYRQSTRSDTTFATDLSSALEDFPGKHTTMGSGIIRAAEESQHINRRKASVANSFDSSNVDMSSCASERSGTPSSLYSTLNDDELQPRSILERRKARKAKVREYKQKDLATVRTSVLLQNPLVGSDAVDSPVLGWFTQSSAKAKRISSMAVSPLSRGPVNALPSPKTTPTVQDFCGHVEEHDGLEHNEPESETSKACMDRDWTISPVMVLESTPAHLVASYHRSTRSTERKNLTLSPLIVVANVAGRPSPSSKLTSPLRPLSLLTTEPVPILPPRSALRLKIKPQRPLPIKVARMSISAMPDAREGPKKRHSISTMPTPPMSPETQQTLRTSFPVQPLPTPPDSGSAEASWDRVSLQRRREKHLMQQKERQENAWLQAHQRDRELEWRITAIKERLRREKMEKEKELADMVSPSAEKRAPIAGSVPVGEAGDRTSTGSSNSNNSNNNRVSIEVEQRLDRLEKSGDAYLRIMVPLLENMNRTLTEMRKDGMASTLNMGLNMNDFVPDMNAEAKRMSLADSLAAVPARRSSTAAVTSATAMLNGRSTQNDENTVHPRHHLPAHKRDPSGSSQFSTASQKLSARVEMNMSRPRSRRNTQTSARGEFFAMNPKRQSIDTTRQSHETFQTGRSSSPEKHISIKPLPSVPQSPLTKELPATPTAPASEKIGAVLPTPKDHQSEALQAIQRRMEKQEAIFGQLMSGWATDNKGKKTNKKASRRPRSSTLPSRQTALAEEEEDDDEAGYA